MRNGNFAPFRITTALRDMDWEDKKDGSSGKLVLFRIKPLRGDTDSNDAKDFHGFDFLCFA